MSRSVGLVTPPSPPVITPASRLSLSGGACRLGFAAMASGISPWSDAANCLLGFPFVLEAPATTFYKGFWVNGSAAGGNSEVGIWDADFNKIVTTGSVAGVTNNVGQSAALSATVTLPPGLYYGGMAHNATTTQQVFRWSATTLAMWQMLGCWRQSGITLGSLGSTATPGDITNVGFPVFGLITRTVFDV